MPFARRVGRERESGRYSRFAFVDTVGEMASVALCRAQRRVIGLSSAWEITEREIGARPLTGGVWSGLVSRALCIVDLCLRACMLTREVPRVHSPAAGIVRMSCFLPCRCWARISNRDCHHKARCLSWRKVFLRWVDVVPVGCRSGIARLVPVVRDCGTAATLVHRLSGVGKTHNVHRRF